MGICHVIAIWRNTACMTFDKLADNRAVELNNSTLPIHLL